MYALYQSGKSLQEVAVAYGTSRQSVFKQFKLRGFALRPKPPARDTIIWNGLPYTRRNNGYFGLTTGDRTLLHRDVWEAANGPIPDGFDIHHLNEDKADNRLENLECLSKAEHTRLYSPHNNQHTRGRKKCPK